MVVPLQKKRPLAHFQPGCVWLSLRVSSNLSSVVTSSHCEDGDRVWIHQARESEGESCLGGFERKWSSRSFMCLWQKLHILLRLARLSPNSLDMAAGGGKLTILIMHQIHMAAFWTLDTGALPMNSLFMRSHIHILMLWNYVCSHRQMEVWLPVCPYGPDEHHQAFTPKVGKVSCPRTWHIH